MWVIDKRINLKTNGPIGHFFYFFNVYYSLNKVLWKEKLEKLSRRLKFFKLFI